MLEETQETQVAETKEVGQDTKATPQATDASADSSPANTNQTPAEGAKPATPAVEPERFDRHPRFREVMQQRDHYKEMVERYQALAERSTPKVTREETGRLAPEQEQAATQLAEILLSMPQFKGLSQKLEQLERQNSELSNREKTSLFDKEEESIRKRCQDYGLNFDEVTSELEQYLSQHPYFGKLKEWEPGFFDLAFRSVYFDKSRELAEKSAHLKLQKEREDKKKANLQVPGSVQSSGKTKPAKMEDWLSEAIESQGGIGQG